MSIVITHKEMGIYLGSFLGLGFWTLLDSAAQPAACVFKDEADAADFIRSWDTGNDPAEYEFVRVEGQTEATISDLKAAGLGHMLGGMETDYLRFAEPAGSA